MRALLNAILTTISTQAWSNTHYSGCWLGNFPPCPNSYVCDWVYKNGSNSPVWVEKNSIFLISDQSQLKRLDRQSGELVWSIKLPYFINSSKKDRNRIIVHYGPILAGGMLIVASSNGLIYTFDPQTGKNIRTISFKGGAATNPVVSNNTLYIVTNSGELIAFN